MTSRTSRRDPERYDRLMKQSMLEARIDALQEFLDAPHPIAVDPAPYEQASDELVELLKDRDGDGPNL